ncbi:hypothetical protein EVJ58_g4356 [Rhodofomes roseus]|uniref:Uncharacterized protein n=1 Tax=Rhodofomes roseus TaxID=34475 RepID=A0A4Y9YGL4_9APHY|nr:hypothetical protein EVJ58_g4356 [Rhodofomes roseus]
MLTAIQLQTIHSIIDAVEGEGSPSGLFYSSYRKNRRAQYLTSQAHNVLVSLRDEMSAVDREVYAVLYARLENTANFHDASRYLQVAEELWEFALGAFQDVSYRSITAFSEDGSFSGDTSASLLLVTSSAGISDVWMGARMDTGTTVTFD